MFQAKRVLKVITFLAIATPLAFVGCKGRGGHGMSAEHIEKMEKKITKKLDLNADQQQKLSALALEIKKTMTEMKDERATEMDFIQGQVKGQQLNVLELRKLLLKKQEAHIAAFDKISPKLETFHASLNAEQKEKVVEFMGKFKQRFQSEK